MEKKTRNEGTTQVIEHEKRDSAVNNKIRTVAMAFIILALVFSLGAIGITFLLFQNMDQTRLEFTQKLESERNHLSQVDIKVNGDISGQLNSITEKMARMKTEQQQFQEQVQQQQDTTGDLSKQLSISNQQMLQSIEVLFKQKGRERIGWVLEEVEYLLLIANHSLQLQGDVPIAIAALEAADSRLLDTGDPGTIAARTQIGEEIQTLKALQQADVVGIAARLSSVIKMLPELPIKYTQINTKEKIAALIEKKASHDAKNLQQASKDFLHELRSLVVLRKMNETPKPLMSPDEKFFLQQNMQLKLETARAALLAGKQTIFSQTLNEAALWLERFFDVEVTQAAQILEELKSLEKMNISTKLPDISASINVLRVYQKELETQQEVNL